MVKSYSIKKIILFMITCQFVCNYKQIDAVCTPDMQEKLQEAFAHNALADLFMNELQKVYNDKALKENVFDYADYYKLINLFDCSHKIIQENNDALIRFKSNDFIETSVKALKFLKKFIENLYALKRGKFNLDAISDDFITFSDYSDKLKEFRKQALIDVLVYSYKSTNIPLSFDFEKFYKDNQYQSFFNTYKQIETENTQDNEQQSKLDNNEIATSAKQSYRALEINQNEHNIVPKNDSEIAFELYKYLREFKENVGSYIQNLNDKLIQTSALKRFFSRATKQRILTRIEQLKEFHSLADQILEAVFLIDLYARPPVAFVQKLEEANPAYRLILAETKALSRMYNHVRSYFLTIIKKY